MNFQDVKAMICLSTYSKKINEQYIILYFNIKPYFFTFFCYYSVFNMGYVNGSASHR